MLELLFCYNFNMAIMMDFNHVFSAPVLEAIESTLVAYPPHVVSSDKDLEGQKDRTQTTDIDEYIRYRLGGFGKDIIAYDASLH